MKSHSSKCNRVTTSINSNKTWIIRFWTGVTDLFAKMNKLLKRYISSCGNEKYSRISILPTHVYEDVCLIVCILIFY